ncbi:MAG: AAA family ATPase [Chloroflexia bacterium]
MPTTRRVLSRLSGGWSVVTRGGEITRTSGAVTGGSAARETGILARERTLRELPRALAAAEREVAEAQATLEERATAVRTAREALARFERLRRDVAQEGDDLRHRLGRFERDCRAVVESLGAIERRLAEFDRAEVALGGELAAIEKDEQALTARLAELERERATALASSHEADQSGQEERSRLAGLRAEVARADERGRGLRREIAATRNQEIALAREEANLSRHIAELETEERDLVAGESGQREVLATTEAEATALAEQLRPLDAALVTARRAEAEASAAMHGANEEALRRESALGARAVETARRRADRDALLRRIAADLEVEDPAALFAAPVPPLPTEERAALEGQVERLAARLRRLGPPNPDIVAEWESESARWKTLTDGLSDVESAARSLRAVLSELDRTMAERFNATFARVADEFADSFTDLFGGGSARLVLAEGNADGTSGVEIIAQPPGKKLQSLSLLSGGERALTAAALLFAILRVNPSPFCVMDEVDAALDESNVIRFRERLKRLADQTQFVVITHNRTTIEGADTLYGITMGSDGVSRALSLRLDDHPAPKTVVA